MRTTAVKWNSSPKIGPGKTPPRVSSLSPKRAPTTPVRKLYEQDELSSGSSGNEPFGLPKEKSTVNPANPFKKKGLPLPFAPKSPVLHHLVSMLDPSEDSRSTSSAAPFVHFDGPVFVPGEDPVDKRRTQATRAIFSIFQMMYNRVTGKCWRKLLLARREEPMVIDSGRIRRFRAVVALVFVISRALQREQRELFFQTTAGEAPPEFPRNAVRILMGFHAMTLVGDRVETRQMYSALLALARNN
jgi:hypothetical protein